MTTILGISAHFHDAAAAIIVDGKIIAAAEQERFSRTKHDASFPTEAIEFCLKNAEITSSDLDMVAYYEKPIRKFDRLLETTLAHAPRGFLRFHDAMSEWLRSKLWLRRTLRQKFSAKKTRFVFPEHHESHAASAFFVSPFDEAAIITADGVGEWCTTSIGVGRGSSIALCEQLEYPHSIGLFYSAITAYCGFEVNEGEYKLMGLAAYGKPIYRDAMLREMVHRCGDGSVQLDSRCFSFSYASEMLTKFAHQLLGGDARVPETKIDERFCDVAASAQAVVELLLMDLAERAHKTTGCSKLVLSGGVALNGVATSKLIADGPFDEVWIQPAAGDSGGAIGAALIAWHEVLGNRREPSATYSTCVGPSFQSADVASYLQSTGTPFQQFADRTLLAEAIAAEIAAGRVVAVLEGAMECGPRALGHRSILADPRRSEMQATLNEKIKFREQFRPFAPAVMIEHASDYFELPRGVASPYMMLVGRVRTASERAKLQGGSDVAPHWHDGVVRATFDYDLPAVTHVDHSARVQTVAASDHPWLHQLLGAFYRLTGCPVLVNTSFNLRGEPIVCTPADAMRTFAASGIDWLVMEDCIVVKPGLKFAVRSSFAAEGANHAVA